MPQRSLQPVPAPLLQRQTGIKHGFFTRCGGVSSGIYASLNAGLGSGDTGADIIENRRRVAAWFGVPAARLLTPSQCHSSIAAVVTAPLPGQAVKADAYVTNISGLAIGIVTADCGAVLLADPQARIIAAVHAGWKGALNGILPNSIEAMLKLGARAENILAVSGPAISRENYEVGEDFRQNFLAKDLAYARYFTPWRGKKHTLSAGQEQTNAATYHCDLRQFICDRLREENVQVEDMPLCTYADAARFFSFRRATHKGEADYGRQISAICLTDKG
ncbi:MAG: peptidoglycan editing factor PgeF [Candidatus Tokpelaia sp.]|nr:MAG: peptidoglycan editing factor PgeF [Candidatus Tokpelaia sp.]KAA6206117.1 MAG: peptidoglycan editing factor PgeF [Candidatus Tokpelaia sp.]